MTFPFWKILYSPLLNIPRILWGFYWSEDVFICKYCNEWLKGCNAGAQHFGVFFFLIIWPCARYDKHKPSDFLPLEYLPTHSTHFTSAVLALDGRRLHRATLIVMLARPVIASEWCALIACELLQHQFVWLSLEEGGHCGLCARQERTDLPRSAERFLAVH